MHFNNILMSSILIISNYLKLLYLSKEVGILWCTFIHFYHVFLLYLLHYFYTSHECTYGYNIIKILFNEASW